MSEAVSDLVARRKILQTIEATVAAYLAGQQQEREAMDSLCEVLDLIGSGQLVRNTSFDADPDWIVKQARLVAILAKAAAIREGKPSHE